VSKASYSKFGVNKKFCFSLKGTNFRNNVQQTAQESVRQIMSKGKNWRLMAKTASCRAAEAFVA